MNSKRVYYILLALCFLTGIAIIAVAILGNSMLEKQSKKLVSLKLDNHVLDAQQTALSQAKKDIDKYQDLEKIANTVVPQEKDQAATVREIVKIADDANIKLSAITFPSSNLGQAVVKSSTGTSVKTPPITQVKPVDNIKGLYEMEITIQQDVNSPIPYDRFISFLQKLENNRRTAQVSNVTVQPNIKDRSQLSFTLTVNVYIKP